MKNADTTLNKLFRIVGNKHEEAVDLYKQAANSYKMEKQWLKAGNAFLKQALCYEALNSKHDAASSYHNAAKCFEKCSIPDAIAALTQSCNYYVNEGRFSMAAGQEQRIGELFEESNNLEEALKHWQNAADYFDGEGQISNASKLKIKIADQAALAEKYSEAINIFETVGKLYLNNTLLKWSAKDLFFKAGICYLCSDDQVGAKNALTTYQDLDVTFSGQRECKLLDTLIECLENGDATKLVVAIRDYNSVAKLDSWKTTMLLRLKDSIKVVVVINEEDMT